MDTTHTAEKSVRVAIYTRVSTDKQTNLNQMAFLKKYAEERKWLYTFYTDIESTKKTRPTKQMLLNEIRSGIKYDFILIWSLDRWARNFTELLTDINELLKNGVGFVSVDDGLNVDHSSLETLKVLASFYNFELKRISERTKLGLERAKLQGKKLGRPFGSKDTTKRDNSGYLIREAKKRKDADSANGIKRSLRYYLNTSKMDDCDEIEKILRVETYRMSKRNSP